MWRFSNGARGLVSLSHSKAAPLPSLMTTTSEEGFRLSCLADPVPVTGLARLTLVFNAGSRYETDSKDLGLTHLLRRAFGLSTLDHTGVNLTRHFQQMGARLTCTTTREHMIYAVDVAPNLLPRAGSLLVESATKSAFYHWELKSTAYPLMRKDVELLTRRNLPALCMELLHEAAFGKNSAGCGLGVSLYAPADRIGTHSFEQIESFLDRFFTPHRCSLSLTGYDTSEEGLLLLRDIKTHLHVRAPKVAAEASKKAHGFAGGDIRRDLAAATHVYANIAWPTHGRTCPLHQAYELAACLLSGSASRVSFGGRESTYLGEDDLTNGVQVVAFNKAYNGLGLFGISLRGPCAKAIGDRLTRLLSALRAAKFTEEDVAKAKTICKADILKEFESPTKLGTDLAVQLSEPDGKYQSPEERAAAIDAVSLNQLNEAVAKALTSPHAALSVVGPNAYEILPLNVLLSA